MWWSHRVERRGLGARVRGAVVCLVVATSLFGQAAEAGSREGKKDEVKGAGKARPIELVVDAQVRRVWTADDFPRLVTTTWKSRTGKDHPAIPLSTVLKETGVPREAVTEIRVISAGKKVVVLKGAELEGQLDQLVLKNDPGLVHPWKLLPLDPAQRRGPLAATGVRRVEVVTAGTTK